VSVSKATIVGNVTALQTFATNPAANSTKNFVTLDGFNNEHALTPSTTPDADDVWGGLVTLSGGAATIDLTALTGADSATKNFDGKKSAGAFTIAKGASNGYTGFGANFSVTLPANASGGAWFMFYDAGGGTAVSGTVKTLDVSGTGAQVLEVIVVAGD
jgi:hypothetical protein